MRKLILRLKLWYFKKELDSLDLIHAIAPDPNYFKVRQLYLFEIKRLQDLIKGG